MGGTSFFIPGGLVVNDIPIDHTGGSPILWQHLFWFFGHPEVYIAILPGMGVTSHILSTFARKPVFGYKAMVYAMVGIGALGFAVWGHHMFVSGMSPYSGFVFSVLTMVIGVPSAIKTFNWIATLWGGKIRFTTPMLYSIGFVSIFVTGGISGIFLGQPSIDLFFHDTYFVVAHFHLIMGVAAIFGMFAGVTFWFPKMTGRMMSEGIGRVHFWLTFIGVYSIFGRCTIWALSPTRGDTRKRRRSTIWARPARTRSISSSPWPRMITITVQFSFLFNVIWSLLKGKKVDSDNPWEATTLEWVTASPPVHDNFEGKIPTVNHGPYEFSVPGAPRDYVMQCNAPDAAPARESGE